MNKNRKYVLIGLVVVLFCASLGYWLYANQIVDFNIGDAQTSGSSCAPTVGATRLSITGTDLRANYANCKNSAVKVDLFVRVNSVWEHHNTCYIKSTSSGFCPFKYTLVPGAANGNVRLRYWSITGDGQKYSDEAGLISPSYYVDMFPPTIQTEPAYSAYSRQITIDKPNYKVVMDRNGGATYEYYNKRATDSNLQNGRTPNAVFTNLGAALQTAIFSWEFDSAGKVLYDPAGKPLLLTNQSCSGQGFWNPTQAGAVCSYRGGISKGPEEPSPQNSGLKITCDNVLNNLCSKASSTVSYGFHRMMNWDYGPGYEGPYEARDQAFLSQSVTAENDYLEYNMKFRNDGYDRPSILLVSPSYYVSTQFRRFFYEEAGTIKTVNIPYARSNTTGRNYDLNPHRDLGWVTIENTFPGVNNYFVTIGWAYDQTMNNYKQNPNTTIGDNGNPESYTLYHHIGLPFVRGRVYGLKYFVFPYRYDEIVETKFGRLSVAETIKRLKAELGGIVLPPPPPSSGGSPPDISLDAPANNSEITGSVIVGGWAMDNIYSPESAISRVEVTVDGKLINSTSYGKINRQDVCNIYPGRANCPNIGFGFGWDSKTVVNGTHTVIAKAFDASGSTSTDSATIKVSNPIVNPPPPPPAPLPPPPLPLPVPPPAPSLSLGLKGEYFGRTNFTRRRLTRVDQFVGFEWGQASPNSKLRADDFSVRWTGKVTPKYTETYTFYTYADDGTRLWVNGQSLVDNWLNQSATEKSGSIALTAGVPYDIKLEYFEGKQNATVKLLWSSPSTSKQIIPPSSLNP